MEQWNKLQNILSVNKLRVPLARNRAEQGAEHGTSGGLWPGAGRPGALISVAVISCHWAVAGPFLTFSARLWPMGRGINRTPREQASGGFYHLHAGNG